ncbi:FimD/PapC C-terminal domain-containing protein [Leclercia sp. CFBP8987]|nr:FimD/PapC C-terminal domain-containing protein [Leclercia sp. CFBP8987]MDY0923884.1 FimD/PapC C-terminal domain-containing protein [Leclercia sp. CFBP8987]
MTLIRANGEAVPFGATVSREDDKKNDGSIVGDGGQVYLSGMSDSGTLKVTWGSRADQTCRVSYSVSTTPGIQLINGDCR